ncbi:MAG: DUF2079 domain-containing protein [Elusimicrobia bacterium]|nr:DUF2079 domain-containing protein [Elusimicrobiota bacterium]
MNAELAPLFRLYAVGSLCTVAAAGAAWRAARIPRIQAGLERAAVPAMAASAVFYVCSVLWMAFGKAAALNQYADRATHLEILWRSTHGLGLTSPMSAAFFTGPHWFAAHFTPLLFAAYWPFFKLFPGQAVLTILQIAYIASAAVPLFLFARKKLGAEPAALVVATFFCYPTLHYIAIYGTAYLELSIPALAWALWALEEERTTAFLAAAAVALSVREEVALVVAALGVYAFLRGRRALGLGVAAAGALYFLIVLKGVIPSYRSDNSLVYMGNYRSWGSTPVEILWGVLSHPLSTAAKLMSAPRLGNAAIYLLPLALLPLLDPLGLLVALPNVATTFMSDSVTNYNFTLYYLCPTIPILFFSTVRGIERLEKFRPASTLPACAALAAASLSCAHFFGPSPISRQFWDASYKVGVFRSTSYHRSQYVPTAAAAAARRLAARVPSDAAVSAPQHLLPLLFDRRRMLVFPALDEGIDYVLIDRSRTDIAGWAETYEDFRVRPEHYYAMVEKDPYWELVAEDGAARLFRRRPR